MKYLSLLFIFLILTHSAFAYDDSIKLATTTSLDNSGFLDYILPKFEKENNVKVNVIAVGTGQALKLGKNGDVDCVFVHDKESEDKFVQGGFGVDRTTTMYNEFVIVGPKDDPSNVKKEKTLEGVLNRIAASHARFISRGDDSGTDKKEKSLWREFGVKPELASYIETGQGMGAALVMASQMKGYALTDEATYLSFRDKVELDIVYRGDERLKNYYSVIAVNPARYPDVKYAIVKKFISYLTSEKTLKMTEDFGKKEFGKSLYEPMR